MRVVCIGDSLTHGYGVPFGSGWVELLSAAYEGRIQFVNAGIDGDTLEGMLYRVHSLITDADMVILMGGTNNVLMGRDATSCLTLLDRIIRVVEEEEIPLMVCLAPPIDGEIAGEDGVLRRYNELVSTYCEERHIHTIDFYHLIDTHRKKGEALYVGDVHVNERGHQYMANLAQAAIDAYGDLR